VIAVRVRIARSEGEEKTAKKTVERIGLEPEV